LEHTNVFSNFGTTVILGIRGLIFENRISPSKQLLPFEIGEYVNKDTNTIKSDLEKNRMRVFVLGNGDKIIRQYPSSGVSLYSNSVVGVLTNNYDKVMPNLIGLSYKDAYNILKLMGVEYKLNGNGYVVSQSIKEGTKVSDGTVVVLNLSR